MYDMILFMLIGSCSIFFFLKIPGGLTLTRIAVTKELHCLGAVLGDASSVSIGFRRAQPEDSRDEWEEARRGF